jgi:hypothetical protein
VKRHSPTRTVAWKGKCKIWTDQSRAVYDREKMWFSRSNWRYECSRVISHLQFQRNFPVLLFPDWNLVRQISWIGNFFYATSWKSEQSKKSDTDHIALISQSDLNKIEHRFDNKAENNLSEMAIHARLRYNPGKSEELRITRTREAFLTHDIRARGSECDIK